MKTNFLKMLITGIDNEDDFREIQEKLFKYGHEWGCSGKTPIRYYGYKYVLVNEDGKIWIASTSSYKDYRQVTVERFLDKDFIGQEDNKNFYITDFLGPEQFDMVQDILFKNGFQWDCPFNSKIKKNYYEIPFYAIKIYDKYIDFVLEESDMPDIYSHYEADWFIQNCKTILGEIKLDDEYIERLTKQYHEEYLNNNKGMPVLSQDLQDTPIKSMNTNGILSFVKNTFLTSDEREMKKAGLFDENLNYTTEALMIVRDLKAKSLGYKNFEEVADKTNQASLSTFELEELYSEFHEELVKYATEYNKSQEKKRK